MYSICRIIARASVDIEKGELVTTCYTHTLSGTLSRQDHLKKGKHFTCKQKIQAFRSKRESKLQFLLGECARCTDPTELGTHFSSMKCSKCDNGYVVSSNPLGI